jgi:hypothetical protein
MLLIVLVPVARVYVLFMVAVREEKKAEKHRCNDKATYLLWGNN